jgi:hypothetical protein
MREDFTVVYEARTVPEAHELIDRLGNEGIRAVVVEEVAQSQAGTDAIGLPTPFSVAVHQEEANTARRIAKEFDDELTNRVEHEAEQPDGAESTAAPEESDPWPQCPECDARRVTVCPICKTSGNRFPSADKEYSQTADTGGEDQSMVLCPTCDEPFVPQYLRQCEWCGHDFNEGIEPNHDQVSEPISPRAMAVILGLMALLAGLLVYFMIIL